MHSKLKGNWGGGTVSLHKLWFKKVSSSDYYAECLDCEKLAVHVVLEISSGECQCRIIMWVN